MPSKQKGPKPPPPEQPELKVGDDVVVKDYGKATVIEERCQDADSKFFGRVRIQYQGNGATYWAQPEKLYKARLVGTTAAAAC